MDNRVRDRRRAVNRERGRRRAGWFVVIAGVLIALGLFLWLRSSDVFAVKRVTATALEHVSTEEVSNATADARGASLLTLSVKEIEKRLLDLPYVRSAVLHRRFPNTLEVVLQEYEPVACVRATDGSRWLVGDDGRVLEKKNDSALPLLVPESHLEIEAGERLPPVVAKALPVTGALAENGVAGALPEITKITISQGGELTLLLGGPIELRLGDPSDLKQKLKVAATIVQQYLRDGKPLQYVDARVPDRPAVKGK
ncbi:MAG TPA: FtsQ-type POTRA domain-containing protein [Thermoleophilia bacterium]|nr:FtsQ-type POTRA domain-containing protein [Thermoleophilia bacterium]